MMDLKVITSVSEPTGWVNSIVIASKPNDSIRLSFDRRNLNKVIYRPRFPFPNIEDC